MPEGAGDIVPLVWTEARQLLHAAADLLPLFRCQALHSFGTVEDVLPLGWRHAVELCEAVVHALLHFGRELAEARLAVEGALLFVWGKPLMLVEPLGKVLLAGTWTDTAARRGGGAWPACGGRGIVPASLLMQCDEWRWR